VIEPVSSLEEVLREPSSVGMAPRDSASSEKGHLGGLNLEVIARYHARISGIATTGGFLLSLLLILLSLPRFVR
jgi:hypothetical protein